MKSNKFQTLDLIFIALFVAFLTIGAYIRIPLPFSPVPISFQLLFVFLSGYVLKPPYGLLSCLLYVLLGLSGLPLFVGGGGIGYLTRPTFGYLLGFIVTSQIIALLMKRKQNPWVNHYLFAGVVGWLALYAVALTYNWILFKYILLTPLDLHHLFVSFFFLFIPNDLLSLYLAIVISRRLQKN